MSDTSGSAFPTLQVCGGMALSEGGITMRDYFAAKAMQAIVSKNGFRDIKEGTFYTAYGNAARGAYEYADEMLKAREL